MRLAGKSVWITGGGTGIGKAFALAFAAEGANVTVSGRKLEPLVETVAAIEKAGGTGLAVAGSVSDASQVEKTVRAIVERFGRLDVLINNAGIVASRTSVTDCTEDDFRLTMDINVVGVFLCSKHALPELIKTQGSIINISSTAGLTGVPNRAAYCASKSAVIALTKSMALDYAPRVRVNCICPGYIETDLSRDYLEKLKASGELDALAKSYPLGLTGTANDIAQAAIFLTSNAAWSTGVILPIDGGVSAKM